VPYLPEIKAPLLELPWPRLRCFFFLLRKEGFKFGGKGPSVLGFVVLASVFY